MTAGRAADMGVLIEVVGVSIPLSGFPLDRIVVGTTGFPHTGNDRSRRGRKEASVVGSFGTITTVVDSRCGGSMPDGSPVHRDERLLRCRETMILAVSITTILGRGQRYNCIHRRRDGVIDRIEIGRLDETFRPVHTQPLLQKESPCSHTVRSIHSCRFLLCCRG